jgi:hypothetical protein
MPAQGVASRPPLAVISATFLVLVIVVVCILAPLDVWWGAIEPEAHAVYHLRHAPNYFNFTSCPFPPAQPWQYIRQQPNAAELFDSVRTHAQTAAGCVMAEAGLMAVGAKSRVTGRESHPMPRDSIRILWAWDRQELVPLTRALEPPLIDSVLALMQRPLPDYEC